VINGVLVNSIHPPPTPHSNTFIHKFGPRASPSVTLYWVEVCQPCCTVSVIIGRFQTNCCRRMFVDVPAVKCLRLSWVCLELLRLPQRERQTSWR